MRILEVALDIRGVDQTSAARLLPSKITPAEIADPVETELRSFSPADIAAIAGTGGGGGPTLAFGSIAVSGQATVIADAAPDTLTLAGANGIAVTTDPATDTLTFAPVYGSGASTVCEGDDARLSDARTPSAHAASHKAGGSDAISITELGGFASGKLAGRTTAGSGALEAITRSANLSLSAGTLDVVGPVTSALGLTGAVSIHGLAPRIPHPTRRPTSSAPTMPAPGRTGRSGRRP